MPHTPGPWKPDRMAVVAANGRTVAKVKSDRHAHPFVSLEEDLLNLALVSAAPQMLTALKAAWFAIDPDTHPDQNRMVRAAIDAAEGKTNG